MLGYFALGHTVGRVALSKKSSGLEIMVREKEQYKDGVSEMELVDDLAAFMTYCFTVRRKQKRNGNGEITGS